MPKGTTPHYQKKNSAMAEAWHKRNAENNASDTGGKIAQRNWRKRCLTQRQDENRVTDKNEKELANLLAF